MCKHHLLIVGCENTSNESNLFQLDRVSTFSSNFLHDLGTADWASCHAYVQNGNIIRATDDQKIGWIVSPVGIYLLINVTTKGTVTFRMLLHSGFHFKAEMTDYQRFQVSESCIGCDGTFHGRDVISVLMGSCQDGSDDTDLE